MKNVFVLLALACICTPAQSQEVAANCESFLSSITPNEIGVPFYVLTSDICEYEGIPLYGKIQFVTSFPDIKIQFVESFPDIKVKFVSSFPDECGLWQVTESFPDIKVQVVTSFPDIKVKVVESFPGMD